MQPGCLPPLPTRAAPKGLLSCEKCWGGVLPAVSPGADVGMRGGVRLLCFFQVIPGDAGTPLLHLWGLVPSQGKDTMTGAVSEPHGAPGEGRESGDTGTWPWGWGWQLG